MLIEKIENETVIRIPNAMLNSTEVQTFITFLERNSVKKPLKSIKKVHDQFEELFEKWQSETALLSSATAIVSHPAYLQMIKMGDAVIPFMLMKLQKNPQHLFFALYQITGDNPVPYTHAGNLQLMTSDWLNWGYAKGYIN
jgi:3-methyladenine DNA glycosylase AlkC